jgi:hypothetical protein
MIPDYCENDGTYATEAKAFCPLSCGVCSGIQNIFVDYFSIIQDTVSI